MTDKTKKMIRNPLFVTGATLIFINLLVALGGAAIRPDSSPFANEQHLELAVLKPGTKVRFLMVRKNREQPNAGILEEYFIGREALFENVPYDSYEFTNNNIKVIPYQKGAPIYFHIADVCLALAEKDQLQFKTSGEKLALVNGEFSSFDKDRFQKQILDQHLFTRIYWFGTDRYGRDVLSRLMSGCIISLSVGAIAVFISLVIGLFLGTVAGYFRGWIDGVIMWFINVVWSVPTLLLVIAVTLLLGKGFWQIFIAVGLTMWVEVARVVRGQVLSLREKDFIQAGIVLGFSRARIITRHLLPNVISPVIVISAANFATAILLEAGLSFLGIGAPPPQATWGKMISENKSFIITGDAHLAFIPGVAIMLLVLSFTFLGNSLRDALDESLAVNS